MLIGDLPQDVTPSVDGTVPYSEDGIHLNFIKIQDLLGLGGGGDGGGDGVFKTIEYPDGSTGYYIDKDPDIDGRGFDAMCEKLSHNPEHFFAEYVTAPWKSNGPIQISFPVYDITYTPDPDPERNAVNVRVNNVGSKQLKTVGYEIFNTDYYNYAESNFPYVLISAKSTVVDISSLSYTNWYCNEVIFDSDYDGGSKNGWTEHQMYDHGYFKIGRYSAVKDKLFPVLRMITPSELTMRLQEASDIDFNGSYGYRYDGSDGRHIEIGKLHGPEYTPRWNGSVSSPETVTEEDSSSYAFSGVQGRKQVHLAKVEEYDKYKKEYRDILEPTSICIFEYKTPIIPTELFGITQYEKSCVSRGSDGRPDGVVSVNGNGMPVTSYMKENKYHGWDRYCQIDAQDYFLDAYPEDLYSSNDFDIQVDLWDIYEIGGEVNNVVIHHIIYDGAEFYVVKNCELSDGNAIEAYGMGGHKFADPYWYSDIEYPGNDETSGHTKPCFSCRLNGIQISPSLMPQCVDTATGIFSGDEVVFDTDTEVYAYIYSVILGFQIKPMSSMLIGSESGIGILAPVRRKSLWRWVKEKVYPTPQPTVIENPVYGDGAYGVKDMMRDAYFYINNPKSYNKNDVDTSLVFGSGVNGAWYDTGTVWAYGRTSSLGSLYGSGGGGGGGSSLPDVDQYDVNKVLMVKNLEGYRWTKGTTINSVKLFGVDSSGDPINFVTSISNNYEAQLYFGNDFVLTDSSSAIRINWNKVNNVLDDYLEMSSVKSGGFNITKQRDSSTGVTNFALDINDIDKFMQLVAGNAISISKSIDSNNVRTYTISGTPLTAYLNHAFKNHRHIPDSTWVTLNTYASSGDYHPSPMQFDAESLYYVDVTVSLEVPANIASGSYVKLILSPYGDEPNEHHTQAELATEVFGSTNGSGSETTNISRSSVLEDTRLLIPGVTNTVRFAGFIAFGALTVNRDLFINIFQNTGLTLGYDAANPGSPASTLGIKTTGYYFKF